MKKKRTGKPKILIAYSKVNKGWIVLNQSGRKSVFASKELAENFCMQKFGQFPVVSNLSEKSPTTHQELPQKSVWTGAPWDRSFEHLN